MIDQKATLFAANSLSLNLASTKKVVELTFEEDCTIPFISRYRKEATGGLDEVQVEAILNAYNGYIELEKRRTYILDTIKKQEMLTAALEKKILNADSLIKLEDLYAPYKSKRKSKGQLAIEAKLQPLADLIKTTKLTMGEILEKHALNYLNNELKFETIEKVVNGVKCIIAEEIIHNSELKETLRKDYWNDATLKSEKKKDADKIKDFHKFKDYFEFEQKIKALRAAKASHRFLAMRRGMTLKVLKVGVSYDEQSAVSTISKKTFNLESLGCSDFLKECIRYAYSVSIHTSLDLEIKSELKLLSDDSAIDVFGINLKNLLLQPYLGQKAVLGIDPGIRTGCKIAAIDKNGTFLIDTVIYPHEPKNDLKGSKDIIEKCIEKLKIEHIAIGNGTFGRETLVFIKENVKQVKSGAVQAMLVNEDGASIYSASEIARKEFPDKDLTVRGAISIARRFQDPLGELVKIDPKSIGVGQYQHDVNQPKLKKSLVSVIENCVNFVGVDLNTASAPLLSYISGIGPTLAGNIVKHRAKISGFKNRQELLKVARFTPKVFEQSAGFLRIYGAKNPFDGTFIHPERYSTLEDWCKNNQTSTNDLIGNDSKVKELQNDSAYKDLLGEFTLEDISKSLLAPSQDPRTEFVSFEFRSDATSLKDIKVNQYYPGIITNLTQFGAFVDIGIKENGLIHVSQIADKFVENALDFLKVGQEVKARVLAIDLDRKRISLTLKSEVGAKPVVQTKTSTKKTTPNKKTKETPKDSPFAALKNFKLK
jgi:uncharacterized protein